MHFKYNNYIGCCQPFLYFIIFFLMKIKFLYIYHQPHMLFTKHYHFLSSWPSSAVPFCKQRTMRRYTLYVTYKRNTSSQIHHSRASVLLIYSYLKFQQRLFFISCRLFPWGATLWCVNSLLSLVCQVLCRNSVHSLLLHGQQTMENGVTVCS